MAALLSIDTDTIELRYAERISGFAARAAELNGRPVNLLNANIANELDTECKLWLEQAEKERVAMKAPILAASRAQDTFWKRMMEQPTLARSICRTFIGRFAEKERLTAAERQREIERLAIAAAEKQRKAEADALLAQAAATGDESLLKAAEEVEATPIVPIVAPAPSPARVEGSTTRFAKVGSVSDARKLLQALLDRPGEDLISELIVWSQSGLNAQVRRGLVLDGVSVTEQPVVSNRSR